METYVHDTDDYDPSEEELDLSEWKGFYSVNEIDNVMPEIDPKKGRTVTFEVHACRVSQGGVHLQIHLVMQGIFKELASLALNHSRTRHLGACQRPDNWDQHEGNTLQKQLEVIKQMIIGAIYLMEDIAFILPPNGEEPIQVGNGDGKYVFVFHLLIGEENMDMGFPVGATYSILANPGKNEAGELNVPMLYGNSMVGAGYAVLSTTTVFVCAFDHERGSHEYIWDKALGEFLLITENISIPVTGTMFSIDHSVTVGWNDATQTMLAKMKNPRFGREGKNYFVGCCVAEHHAINMEGGLYFAPANKYHPSGTLLLIYECWPLAYVTREAGGFATDGRGSILEARADALLSRAPYFGGSSNDAFQLMYYNGSSEAGRIDHRQIKQRSVDSVRVMPWTWQGEKMEKIHY